MGGLFARSVLVSAGLALAAALGAVLGSSPQIGQASQVSTAMGVDADTTGNSATSLGDIDACVSVEVGQTFDVDVFVANVAGLLGWQAALVYDPAVLRVADANVELFLAGPQRGRMLNLSDLVPDQDGGYAFAVVDATPDSEGHTGSGVLARMTLEAVGTGMSFLTLDGIVFADPAGSSIGDVNGDDIFDGTIAHAQVWVGEPCPGTLPAPTPSASPTGAGPTATVPPATPTSTGVAASPTGEAPSPVSPTVGGAQEPASTDEGGGFPWAVVAGAVAATIVATLAAALALRWLLARAS